MQWSHDPRNANLTTCHRLKLLKDEIKKPYFLTLKRFLANEGVKGLNNSAPNLKVYPARKSNIHGSTLIAMEIPLMYGPFLS